MVTKVFQDLSIRYLGTFCNFITFEAGSKSVELFEYLLKNGVIVRPLVNYKLEKYLRVTLGTKREMNIFIKTLKSFYNNAK